MTSPVRVLLVDDDPMAATGLAGVLAAAADIEVVTQCADGDQIAGILAGTKVDVVMCDVRMPRMDGPTAVATNRDAGVVFLMMTAYDDEGAALRAIEAGAMGFMLKGDDPKRIIAAVRSVAAGDAEFSPRVAKQLAMWVRNDEGIVSRRDAEAKVAMLSEREREFASAVVEGLSDAEIATRLFVAEATVKSTLAGIRLKWNARTRTDVAVIAVRAGLA